MKALEDQLKASVEALEQEKLRYALAGGLAAAVYRNDDRVTKDVDFIIGGTGDLVKAGTDVISVLGLRAFKLFWCGVN